MGNEQSVPVGERAQNRLSKPKTNASTSNLLSSPSNLLSMISKPSTTNRQKSLATDASTNKTPYSFTPIEGFAGEAGDRWKDEQPTQRKRLSLFRSKSSQDKPKLQLATGLDADSPDPSPGSALDPPPLPIWGNFRAKSSPVVFTTGGEEPYYDSPVDTQVLQPPMSSRILTADFSTRPQLRDRKSIHSSSQQQARLSLVAEVPSPQSDIPRRKPIPQDDNPSIGQAISTRSNSDAAIYAPIRRRSLQAHGVATRTSYVEPDLPQPHPPRGDSLQDLSNYYYDPTKPTSSPLSDLAMMGPNPAFMHEGPRAETPTEANYGHLGGFSGTLRITNGAASPAPSSRRANSLGAEDDFFETRKNSEMGHRPGLSQRSNTISVAGEGIKAPWSVPSPLRTSEAQSDPLTIDTHREKDVSQRALNSEQEKKVLEKTESPTKGHQVAPTGRQNGVLSPFSFANSPTSPQFQATSKHTAVEDELFETEPESPDPSADLASHAPRSFDSGYGGGENSPPGVPAKDFPESSSAGLAKADSGYSSNVSLRSFKKDSSPASTRRTLHEPDSRVASSNSSVESDAALKARDFEASLSAEEAPAPPAKQPPPPFRQPPPVPMGDQSFAGTPRSVQPPPIPQATALAGQAAPQAYGPTSSPENSHQQSAPAIASTAVRDDSAADSDISASAPANSSSRWRQKLTKRDSQPRIATKQIFTVQAIRSPSEAYKIPPPTMEARRRLEEREDAFPVQCFPNTVEGTTASKRMSMGTIFSVGSLEASDESRLQSGVPPVPPMPTIIQEPNQAQPEESRRNTYQAPTPDVVQPPTQDAQSSQPASPERGRSQRASWARQFLQIMPRDRTAAPPEDLGFLESHVTSFETVSHSLGRDAYDIARLDQQSELVDQRAKSAKSMTQRFEADAAARFAASKEKNAPTEPVIRPRKSYDSVMNGNKYSPGSGQLTSTSLRDSRDFSHVAQSSATRRSYTNLPAQSSLLNPMAQSSPLNPTERRQPSTSPPPVSTPVRGQSVTRKPLPSPAASRPSSIHTRKTAPSPLSQHQDGLWAKRRLSTTSLVSMRTTMTFDSSRTRPDTYEIIPIDDFKKKHPKRGSTINLSSFSGEDPDYRPSSSKGSTRSSIRSSMRSSTTTTKGRKRMSQSRESPVINMRDRDVIPRTNYPTLGRKSLENMRPRSKGALDAVSERDEIPNFGETPAMPSPLTENPNLNLKDRRWKEELKRKSQNADPSVSFSEEPPLPPLPRQKIKGRKSEETLTLRDLQQQELAKRRPRSVQPSRAESKRIREEERVAEERSQRLLVEKERAKERVKEKRKSRWDAYTHIFGERGKGLKKEQISAPIRMDPAELERSYSATPVY